MSPARQTRGVTIAALDAISVLAAALAVLLLLFGSWRIVLAGSPMSLTWAHALFIALGVTAVRHAAAPTPTIAARFGELRDRLRPYADTRQAVAATLLTRVPVLLVGFFACLTFGALPSSDQPPAVRHTLRDLPARFDANWYAGIAAHGYDWQNRFDRQQNVAFFPALPMAMRAAGLFTGAYDRRAPFERRLVRFAWAGLAVSLLAFAAAAVYFARLSREILGDGRAPQALMLLASYPFAAFFSAAYTESIFLLAGVGAWWHLRRGEHVPAGAWALLAGLTRPNGFLLSVPLALLALGIDGTSRPAPEPASAQPHRRTRPASAILQSLAVAAVPTIGMLLFTVWLYTHTNVWFAWARIQPAWGRVVGGIGVDHAALASVGLAGLALEHPYQAMNALGLLFAFLLLGAVWRRVGPAWAVYVALTVGLPLAAGGLLSMGRLTSTLFPLFLALAAVLPPRAVPWVVASFGLLQGFVAALFYTWRSMY